MQVRILRHPTDADWSRCYYLATSTGGHAIDRVPTVEWRRRMLRAGHSPIRTLWWTIELVDVPYWVSVHLVRHKVGVEHYVRSQRNDRQHDYDRTKAPQDAPVTHVIDINAAALMQMCRMRLCMQAAPETRAAVELVRDAVLVVSPEMDGLLAPTCERYGTCDEMRPCGRMGA
jgi:thymidylate synthase ThyX